MEHNEESIDLSKLLRIMVEKKKLIAGIIGACTLLAVVIAFILPKQYESTTLVQTRSAGSGVVAMAAVMGISTGGSSSGSPLNYMELMKSRTVLEPIIDSMEWKDEKKKPDAEQFAKKNLDIKNTKQTNLITVTAKGKTPEEAQMISQSVVDNFLMMQTDKNQQTQSLLVKFLNQRIEDAKKDADEASQKFADYQKEHKVYSPEEQAKETVSKMNAFDNAIGDMEVQQKASQAELDTANAKLGEMKAASRSYQINDNTNVQGIRNQIVAKQLQLVDLNQKYTEEHPSVIAAKKELSQLQSSLANEVNAVVASNATSMNPTQASLMQKQAQAQASIAVARASETLQDVRIAEGVELDAQIENGKIANYQAVVPSTWNAGPRDVNNQAGAYEASLQGHVLHDPKQPVEILRTIHSFDPCIACAVHVTDPEGEELVKVQVR